MLAISGNINYYRISTQFAITKLFCEQNFWPMDAFDFVRKLVDKMIFLLEYPFRSYMVCQLLDLHYVGWPSFGAHLLKLIGPTFSFEKELIYVYLLVKHLNFLGSEKT